MQMTQKNDDCCKTAKQNKLIDSFMKRAEFLCRQHRKTAVAVRLRTEQNKLIVSYDGWCMRRFRECAELLCDQRRKMAVAVRLRSRTSWLTRWWLIVTFRKRAELLCDQRRKMADATKIWSKMRLIKAVWKDVYAGDLIWRIQLISVGSSATQGT